MSGLDLNIKLFNFTTVLESSCLDVILVSINTKTFNVESSKFLKSQELCNNRKVWFSRKWPKIRSRVRLKILDLNSCSLQFHDRLLVLNNDPKLPFLQYSAISCNKTALSFNPVIHEHFLSCRKNEIKESIIQRNWNRYKRRNVVKFRWSNCCWRNARVSRRKVILRGFLWSGET